MLVGEIIAQVRDVLQDLDTDDIRYPTSSLIRALNLAVLQTRGLRPDYFVGTFTTPIPRITSEGEDIPLPDELLGPLVQYVAGWAEMRDDEFTIDSRAAILLKSYEAQLGVG